MGDGGNDDAAPAKPTTKKKPQYWRPWLRAMHRDIGYVAVGLTFVYALSGLAVNHLTDWSDGDASFKTYSSAELTVSVMGTAEPDAYDASNRSGSRAGYTRSIPAVVAPSTAMRLRANPI